MRKGNWMKLSIMFVLTLALLISGTTYTIFAPNTAYAEEQPLQEKVISAFEQEDESWLFSKGAEFPGATGEFAIDPADFYSGNGAGKLTGNFTVGGEYVSIFKPITPIHMEKLSMQVKSGDARSFGLRLLDHSGQWHQQTIDLQSVTDWQQVDITSMDAGKNASHWGGADDGIWHGPGVGIQLLLSADSLMDNKNYAVISFDNLKALTPAPPFVIKQNQLGNLFSNQKATFTIQKAEGNSLAWRVTDFWGKKVASATEAIIGMEKKVELPKLGNGYYTFQVEVFSGSQSLGVAKNTFAILPTIDLKQTPSSLFGVVTHFGQTWDLEMLPLVAQLGAKNIRDEMFWHPIEQEKGEYTFPTLYNEIEQKSRKYGLDPLILLTYVNPLYDHGYTPYSNGGRKGFANYGKAVLDKYPKIKWVEVYNEFNIAIGDIGEGPADSKPEYYYKLLKETYTTIKASHPEVTVVGATTAGLPWDWLEELFKLGGLKYMDAVSVHPYRYPFPPEDTFEDIVRLNNLIKKYNGGKMKPIWGTEVGWPTQLDNRGVGEGVQARYAVRSYVQALAVGMEKLFWYDFMNDGLGSLENEHNFGLVRFATDPLGKYAPKPAYVAYGIMTRQLTGKPYIKQVTVGDGIYNYVFGKGNMQMQVLWSIQPKTLALKTDKALVITDIMGKASTLTPGKDGYAYLAVTENPVYVSGSVTTVKVSGKLMLTHEENVKDEPVTVSLSIDNTKLPKNVLIGTLEIEGKRVPFNVKAGEKKQIKVKLPAIDNDQTVYGKVVVNGKTIANLSTAI
jgi:hypothetical protein